MKRHQQDKNHLSRQVATLESVWAKKQKTNELSNRASNTSEQCSKTTTEAQTQSSPMILEECSSILVEAQADSTSSMPNQHQSVASSNVRLCDISASSGEPPVQSILPFYPINEEKRCFQSQWYQTIHGSYTPSRMIQHIAMIVVISVDQVCLNEFKMMLLF